MVRIQCFHCRDPASTLVRELRFRLAKNKYEVLSQVLSLEIVCKPFFFFKEKKSNQEFYSSPTEAYSPGSRFSESFENWPTC